MDEVSSAGKGKSANANQKSGSSWRLIKSAQSNETLHGEARVAYQEASTLELRAHLLLSARFATYGEHRAEVERAALGARHNLNPQPMDIGATAKFGQVRPLWTQASWVLSGSNGEGSMRHHKQHPSPLREGETQGCGWHPRRTMARAT